MCTSKKQVILLYFCLVLVVAETDKDYYDRRYDYYDIDHLIQNPRLLKKYLDCFLDKGPCTPIGRLFKQVLPEVVTTACGKCTTSQKRLSRKTFNAFKRYFPETFAELKKKLDPQDKYYTAFEKAISSA
ncbi:hypothetical protein K1T71_010241 [Dendrolimus kikuchii]|uniref:Uncharacterized protein n=1 Tax=Dendrolimus kikuchii TaxID=765133 RepID=A0ACC1CRQ1_9NEOP|nr:hypothetical protein K1T71_010241 [Dendrolimus kikuchii]